MQRIAAVVVTYNRREMLIECVRRILAQREAAPDVLVVDNASTDGTAESVAALKERRVMYKNTGKNLGGAGGFNFGIRWAVEEGYDGVWIMDDDTWPEPDALSELLAAGDLLKDEWAFLSSVALWTDGSGCLMNKPGVSNTYETALSLLSEGILRVDQATFVSMLLKAETVERAGLPIRDYFIWGDDIEYSRRICVRMKLPGYLVGKSRVVHRMKENSGSNLSIDVPERIPRYRLAFRNEGYTFRKEGWRGIGYYMIRCGACLKNIIVHARDHRLRRLGALLGGMLSGLFFHPKVEYVQRPKALNGEQHG